MRVGQTDILNNTFFAVGKRKNVFKKYVCVVLPISALELWTHGHDRSRRVCLVGGPGGVGVRGGKRGGRVR